MEDHKKIMSRLLELVAKNAFNEGKHCLRQSAFGQLCLNMLARRMNELDTGQNKTVIFTFTKDDELMATLRGSAFRRYGQNVTHAVVVTREEFKELLETHFSVKILLPPVDVIDWKSFGECLNLLQGQAQPSPHQALI